MVFTERVVKAACDLWSAAKPSQNKRENMSINSD